MADPKPADPDTAAELKSLAKAAARDASARIGDRRLRAEVRTDCYNHLVAALQQIDHRHLVRRARQQRIQKALAVVALVQTAALGAALLL